MNGMIQVGLAQVARFGSSFYYLFSPGRAILLNSTEALVDLFLAWVRGMPFSLGLPQNTACLGNPLLASVPFLVLVAVGWGVLKINHNQLFNQSTNQSIIVACLADGILAFCCFAAKTLIFADKQFTKSLTRADKQFRQLRSLIDGGINHSNNQSVSLSVQ